MKCNKYVNTAIAREKELKKMVEEKEGSTNRNHKSEVEYIKMDVLYF